MFDAQYLREVRPLKIQELEWSRSTGIYRFLVSPTLPGLRRKVSSSFHWIGNVLLGDWSPHSRDRSPTLRLLGERAPPLQLLGERSPAPKRKVSGSLETGLQALQALPVLGESSLTLRVLGDMSLGTRRKVSSCSWVIKCIVWPLPTILILSEWINRTSERNRLVFELSKHENWWISIPHNSKN